MNVDAYNEYQKMVDDIFGLGTITVCHVGEKKNNNVIGSWRNAKEFCEFKTNFQTRLFALKNFFRKKKNLHIIKNLVASIGDEKNWEGAYAELVAYNILKTDNCEYTLDVTRKASFAIAQKMGMDYINYDVYLPDYGIYMDVKAFTDTIGDILNHSVISKVLLQEEFKSLQLNILPQHPLDEDNENYVSNVRALQKELTEELRKMIAMGKKRYSYSSKIVGTLSMHILQGAGVNCSESCYSPYRHAESMKDFIIQRYCNKFPYRAPFFLVLVNFPWYNQITRDSFEYNSLFYRSIARRTFIQYEKNTIYASQINSKIKEKCLARNVARKLTGIIFIDDNSIQEDSYNTYIYLNPNAKNKRLICRTYLEEILRNAKKGEIDDFNCDNY